MSPRPRGHLEDCTSSHALVRLNHARVFLDVATLVGDDPDDLAHPGVSAALSVLSGIAASDAICCSELKVRSRGRDHYQAKELLKQVNPNGRTLSKSLDRLLDIKDGAHYGVVYVSDQRAKTARKHARILVDAAGEQLREWTK